MNSILKTTVILVLFLFTATSFAAKKFQDLGPYRNVTVMNVSYKGIQISHLEGISYIKIDLLSPEESQLIAEEIEEYKKQLKDNKKVIAAEKAKLVKDKKAADKFAADVIKILGQPKPQPGYLLTTFLNFSKRYKYKITIPKRNKDNTLPLLYKQYAELREFIAQKTENSDRQKEVLFLLDKHYRTYQQQRQVTINARNKKLAAAKKKKPAAKPAAPAAKPAAPAKKEPAKPAPAPAKKEPAKPAAPNKK